MGLCMVRDIRALHFVVVALYLWALRLVYGEHL